ncbi:MAG: methyltransferase, partial [Desulfobulbaceae bacterium]|nr:methyltransferase [Desulfobulbaceae bacterium]
TTRDCIEAIECVSRGKKVTKMLDLGTGTGILALAGIKLGCKSAVAVDYNYLAAQTAQNNVVINGLQDSIVMVNGRAEDFTHIPSDLLVANIHYDVMKDIVRSEGFYQQKWFILSGLLQNESTKILDYLATQKVLIIKVVNQEKWCTIMGITNPD